MEVSRDEFCEVCERLGADAQRGLSLKQFIATYTDHPELEADIDEDYDLVFPVNMLGIAGLRFLAAQRRRQL